MLTFHSSGKAAMEALFLSGLPSDFPAPYLDPHRGKELRSTRIPIMLEKRGTSGPPGFSKRRYPTIPSVPEIIGWFIQFAAYQ
jgi:hypothetical protein